MFKNITSLVLQMRLTYTLNMRVQGLKKKRLKVDKGLKCKVKAISVTGQDRP